MLRVKFLILFFLAIVVYSCSDNPVAPVPYNLIYDRPGLIENLTGDCSYVLVRTQSLGDFDLTLYDSLRFEFDNSTDTDLSSFQIFYKDSNNIAQYLTYVEGLSVDAVKYFNTPSPKVMKELFLRTTLYSSECTGQVYHLSVRDLKILAK